MKNVYAQAKKVCKRENPVAKEKADRTLKSSKKILNSLQVSVTRSASYAWNRIPRVPQEKSGGGVLYANLGLTSVV